MDTRVGSAEPVWVPSFGAWPDAGGGVRFRVWAPAAVEVAVVFETGGPRPMELLEPLGDGSFAGRAAQARPGDRYRLRIDGDIVYPDPASRFQPEGVHGPSEVVDPSFPWTDEGWKGVAVDELVFYELHVGTFSPEGTFAGVEERLPYLKSLGVTAIELMPVADFAGDRNWGYDGVSLFAPSRCYGRPDDLRQLIDAAHRIGLGVFLDVVYNHLGPDGAYLSAISPQFFSSKHESPWGAGVNFDDRDSGIVRSFLIDNALHWVHEYHIDGLRLDATHALVDDSETHFVAELTARVHGARADRRVLVVAEDHRNLAMMLRDPEEGGWGLDAVWADDFHHHVRRLLAGDREGYYRDFMGTTVDLATTMRQGWFHVGQHSAYLGKRRGTDPAGIPPRKFVVCLQNHDQIGNRAFGERLHHEIDLAAYRAASVLLLLAPTAPLLFMGQEWAASTPFLYFTDHHEELGRLITEGRRREFRHFTAFSDPGTRERIPDPQDPETYHASRLIWSEQNEAPHLHVQRLYRALLALRRTEPALRAAEWSSLTVRPAGEDALLLRRDSTDGPALAAAIRLRGAGAVSLDPIRPGALGAGPSHHHPAWSVVLQTEDHAFSPDSTPPDIEWSERAPVVRFPRPAAVLFRLQGEKDRP